MSVEYSPADPTSGNGSANPNGIGGVVHAGPPVGWAGILARATSGVLLSLFVCPGLGHRLVGRKRAAWIVFFLFMGSFLFLCMSTYFFVFHTVQAFRIEQLDLPALVGLAKTGLKDSLGLSLSLGMLVAVYLLAPLELLGREVWRMVFAQSRTATHHDR